MNKASTFISELVEENPADLLIPENERKKALREIFIRSRQYITICMVLETIRMVYLNTSNYKPYEMVIWILELLCLFIMFIIILKSYKQKELVRYLVIIFQFKMHLTNYESNNLISTHNGSLSLDIQLFFCELQSSAYILTNWYLISQMFSNKYWIKVFPFELIVLYVGTFLKIFGGT